jgi:hypothetical protein
MAPGNTEQALTIEQEFSIEIPDKEADAIHSGTFFNGETASSRSALTFYYSRSGSRVHHPPARWYVVSIHSANHKRLTQLQLTRSLIRDGECFCMESTWRVGRRGA